MASAAGTVPRDDVTVRRIGLGPATILNADGPGLGEDRPALERLLVAQEPEQLRPGAITCRVEVRIRHGVTLPGFTGNGERLRCLCAACPLLCVNHRYALITMTPAATRPARAPPSPLGQRGTPGHGRPRLNPPASSSAAMRAAIGGCVWNIPPRLPNSPRPFTNGDSMYRCAVARPTWRI